MIKVIVKYDIFTITLIIQILLFLSRVSNQQDCKLQDQIIENQSDIFKLSKKYISGAEFKSEQLKVFRNFKEESILELPEKELKIKDLKTITSFIKTENKKEKIYIICGENNEDVPLIYKYGVKSSRISKIDFPDFASKRLNKRHFEAFCNLLEGKENEEDTKSKILVATFKGLNYIGLYDILEEKWLVIQNQFYGEEIIYHKFQQEIYKFEEESFLYLLYLDQGKYKLDKIQLQINLENSKINLNKYYSKTIENLDEKTRFRTAYFDLNLNLDFSLDKEDDDEMIVDKSLLYLINSKKIYKYSFENIVDNEDEIKLVSANDIAINKQINQKLQHLPEIKLQKLKFLTDSSKEMYFLFKSEKSDIYYWGILDISTNTILYESTSKITNLNSFSNEPLLLASNETASYLLCPYSDFQVEKKSDKLDFKCSKRSFKKDIRQTTECYETCETCKTLGDKDNQRCVSCKDGYTQVGRNCYKSCESYEGFNSKFECINCKTIGKVKIVGNPYCTDPFSITNAYFYVQTSPEKDYNVIDFCYETCGSCKAKGISQQIQNCTSCKNGIVLSEYPEGNCLVSWCAQTGQIIIDKKCYNCRTDFTPSLYSYNSICISYIPVKYYLYIYKYNYLYWCYDNCTTCSGQSTCTTCNYLYYERESNRTNSKICEKICDDNYYLPDYDNRMCLNCKFNTTAPYHLLKGLECISLEPDRDYAIIHQDSNTIAYCDESCNKCTGAGNTKCSACADGYYKEDKACVKQCSFGYVVSTDGKSCVTCKSLGKYMYYFDPSKCVDDKPFNSYMNDTEKNIYDMCNEGCNGCTGRGDGGVLWTNCTSCADGYITQYLWEGKNCFKKCPDVMSYNADENLCYNCYDIYFFKFIDKNECIYNVTTRPLNTYIKNRYYGILDYCGKSCATCTIGPNSTHENCESCDSGKVLTYLEKECADDCGDMFYLNNKTHKCGICRDVCSYYYKFPGNPNCVVKNTRTGFYIMNEEFNYAGTCDSMCDTCNGPSYNSPTTGQKIENCIRCSGGYGIDDDDLGQCVNCSALGKYYFPGSGTYHCVDEPNVPYFFYNKNLNYIVGCSTGCKDCYGSYSNCSSCKDGYFHTAANRCTSNCDPLIYAIDAKTNECICCKDKGLYKVYSALENECISEPTRGYIFISTYYNTILYCYSACKQCYNIPTDAEPHNCKSCVEGYYLQPNSKNCLKTCPNNYVRDNTTSTCLNCKQEDMYKLNNESDICRYTSKTVPENTFVINTEYNIISFCGSSCRTCSAGPEYDDDDILINDNCDSCPEGYHFVYSEDHKNKTCVKCGILYGLPLEVKDQDMCQLCPKRGDEFAYKYNQEESYCIIRPHQDIKATYIVKGYESYNLIDDCYPSCKECSDGPVKNDGKLRMNCLSCLPDYSFNEGNCEAVCDDLNEGLGDDGECINCRLIGKYRYRHDKKCISEPENGYIFKEINYNVIEDCDPSCKKCQDTPYTCTECYSGTFLDYNGDECVISCNSLFDDFKPLLVEDPVTNKCVNCKDIDKYKYLDDTACTLDNKPDNTYYESERFNVIGDCDVSCDGCYGKANLYSTNCKKCAKGFYAQVEDPTNCLLTCPAIYYAKDDVNRECINCRDVNKYKHPDKENCVEDFPERYYYVSNNFFNLLTKCPDKCEICSLGINNNSTNTSDDDYWFDDSLDIEPTCSQCEPGYYVSYEDKKCVESCGELYGISDDGKYCEKCTERAGDKTYKFKDGLYCIEHPENDVIPTVLTNAEYGIIERCYKGCERCTKTPNLTPGNVEHFCTAGCKIGYDQDGTNCIPHCSDFLVYDELNDECVNCTLLNKVKNMKDNTCIEESTKKTPYYYVPDSNNGTIADCYSLCGSCFDSPSDDGLTHNCLSCIDGYFLDGVNCVEECPTFTVKNDTTKMCQNCTSINKYYLDGKCVKDKTGYYIPELYKDYNLLISCDSSCADCEGSPYNCTACKKGKFLFENKCLDECDKNYYVEDETQNKCVNCKDIDKYKVLEINECIDEPIDEIYSIVNDDFNLIAICNMCGKIYDYDYNNPIFSVDTSEKLQCADEFYLQPNLKNTSDTSAYDDLYNDGFYEDDFICFETCPTNYAKDPQTHTCVNCKDLNQYKCVDCEYCTGSKVQPEGTTLINEEFNIIDNCTMVCENNYSTIYQQHTLEAMLDESEINVDFCSYYIQSLRMSENLNESELTVIPMINPLVDAEGLEEIQLRVFNESNNEFFSSICKKTGETIMEVPLTESVGMSINVKAVQSLLNKGVSVSDLNQQFYNDFCTQFDTDEANIIPFVLRKNLLGLNQTAICGSTNNCTISNIDDVTNKITCVCNNSTKSGNSNSETEYKNSNFYVIRCMNLVFDSERLPNNKGCLIVLSLLAILIANYVIYAVFGTHALTKTLFPSLEIAANPPPKKNTKNSNNNIKNSINNEEKIEEVQEGNIEGNQIVEENIISNATNNKPKTFASNNNLVNSNEKKIGIESLESSFKNESKNDDIFIYDAKKGIKFKNDEQFSNPVNNDVGDERSIQPFELDYLSFEDTIKYDKRKFYEILYDSICDKFMIFFLVFKENDLCLKTSKLAAIIFTLIFNLLINALVFNEKLILEKFYYGKTRFSTSWPYAIIGSICSFVVFSLIKFFIKFERSFIQMRKNENSNVNGVAQLRKFCEKSNKINILVFGVIFLLLIPAWYYISAFSAVFISYTDLWLHISFESLNILYGLQFLIAFIYAIIKYYEITHQSSCCGKVVKVLNYL